MPPAVVEEYTSVYGWQDDEGVVSCSATVVPGAAVVIVAQFAVKVKRDQRTRRHKSLVRKE